MIRPIFLHHDVMMHTILGIFLMEPFPMIFFIESAPKFFLAFGIDCGRWFLPTLVLPAVIPEATRRVKRKCRVV